MSRTWYPLSKTEWKNKKTAYINARIIDPYSRTDVQGVLVTEGKKISEMCGTLPANVQFDKIIDCKGNALVPGLVDIHVHFRDPGFEYKENIESGSMAASSGGVTTVVCQPNTNPTISTVEIAQYIKYKAAETSFVKIEFYASVTNNKGELTDMVAMSKKGSLGFTDDGMPVSDSFIMRTALETANSFGFLIAQHAEDLALSKGGCMNLGPTSQELGLNGIPNISESVMVARDVELMNKLDKAHYHVLHISTKESLEIVKNAKKLGMNVTCEVAPHHFILTDQATKEYGTMAKMNPPLRSQQDVDAMIEGIKNGYIDCIATDHAPHDSFSKESFMSEAPFGIIGLETLLPLSLELHYRHGMDLIDVLSKITCAPADIVKLNRGRICPGHDADLALVDLKRERVIENSDFCGKSKNSPFAGRKVKGLVLRTIVNGETVYKFSD